MERCPEDCAILALLVKRRRSLLDLISALPTQAKAQKAIDVSKTAANTMNIDPENPSIDVQARIAELQESEKIEALRILELKLLQLDEILDQAPKWCKRGPKAEKAGRGLTKFLCDGVDPDTVNLFLGTN